MPRDGTIVHVFLHLSFHLKRIRMLMQKTSFSSPQAFHHKAKFLFRRTGGKWRQKHSISCFPYTFTKIFKFIEYETITGVKKWSRTQEGERGKTRERKSKIVAPFRPNRIAPPRCPPYLGFIAPDLPIQKLAVSSTPSRRKSFAHI